MNRAAFYDSIRPHLNLTTQNVAGTERILDYAIQRREQINDLAYKLATAWWETSQTMQPVVEAYWLSEDWRKRNLRYYPWHGRGLIQTTWERNYRAMGERLHNDPQIYLDAPDLLLEWEHALPAMWVGMDEGIYTGKAISDYIDDVDDNDAEQIREYINARRVVNGTDKAAKIAELALRFEHALHAAGYMGTKPLPSPDPAPPKTKEPIGWLGVIMALLALAGFIYQAIGG